MKTFNQIRQELAKVNEATATSNHPQIKRDQKDAHAGSLIHKKDGHEIHTAEHDEGVNFHHHDKNTGKHHVVNYDISDHDDDMNAFHRDAKKQHPTAPKHVISAIHKWAKNNI